MFEPIIIKLDYSPRDERHSKQIKSVASRLGKRIGRGLASRPNIGKNRRTIGSGRIDIPTGGVRGYKRPTGNRRDIDRDGWADEGTTNPVWVGLSGGRDRPIIETQRARPKINLNNQKINERKKIRQKIKYGESSLDGKLISKKNGPKWLDGLSNEQISNILVPDSYQTYSQMLADGFGVDKETIEKYLESRWGVGKPWLEIDYSESSTKQLKQALKTALDESPIFSWAVRNYGSPTYTVMTRKSAETYNNRDAVKPLYDALKKMYPDAPGEPQFAASNHLDFEMVTFNPINVIDKKSWQTNEPISSSFQTSKLPSSSDTVIDRSISGTILHEWAHWYHSEMLLANIESSENKKRSPKSLVNPQDSDFAEKIKIALEYNSDNGNMNLHSTKKPLEDSQNEPRTITSYGHVSRKEMFAEGMLAYMHPNEQLKLKAINKKLRQDIETILAGDKGVDAWKDSKANIRREKNILSSGRKNRKLTKLSSGSKDEKPTKPTYPRHPSYGPFLDGAEDLFADAKNWKEFKEVYDNLEINFFDYETTGLVSDEFRQSSGNGAPVQFGVTKTKGGKEIGRLNIFMNPGEELGDWSRKNLKNKDGEPLTDEWLSSQTSIADAHRKLIEFVGPDAIFGVQNAVFDKTVLEDALTSSGIEWRPKGWVDTKVVSDLVIPKWTKENQDAPWTTDGKTGEKIPSSSLKALTEYLNIDLGKKHHTADADAAATSELMSKIIDKAIEKNWSNDIFDKNWRDQKIKDKLENYQQEIIDFEQQKSNWISETSPKKSTVPKEVEKKEFGFGRLSSGTTSYKGRHESPDASSGAPLHNLANGAIYPEDIYGPNGANLYGGAFPDLAQKAVAIFRKLRNKPDSELTIYRAVPRGKNIKEGDWVTILPEYAKIHGDSWLKDNYEIVTKKVKAKELFNEGNSLLEFGYHSKLSSGKYDGAPTYKGKVWKDRKNELDGPVWSFRSQAKQYPDDGPPGISYFKGVVDDSTWVDCLLYRDDSGKVIGILNHYPFALVDPDDPRIVERRGNINIFIDPKHQGKGIATKLVDEAVSRYNVDLRRQRYSEEGANFINRYIRKLPENRDKSKLSSGSQPRINLSDEESDGSSLSSGATESIKDIWNGSNKYIQFQTYKNMEIGFTGEARLRDVPSGKRFVRMRVIDSTTGKPRRLENDEVRTFSEKTISAAIDWLLDRQIQTEKLGSVSDGFVLSEEQFKEFLAADINPVKAKPDSNTKKYPLIKKNFKVDEKELLSLSEEKPNNRILVQVTNRFWFDHLSRLDSEIDGSEVRGRFRTEIKLNHSELSNLISDADYYIETARLPDEEFDSMGAEELIDALIKQGVPIENGKLKLSSGSQPRINLSDEEKREIIAIASQRTDDFSKSVVEQFRRNGKLSDRQWNALNKATLRRSRLSSGKNTDTEPRFLPIENLAAARDPNTDTNLQTPVNWEARGTRYATRRGRAIKIGREIAAPLELQLAIVEDYKDTKKTLAFIAKKHNVSIDYVSLLARQFNLPYRKNIRQNLTGVQQANIVEAIKAGIPNKEIRKKFNITKKQLERLKYISETARERELRLSDKKIRREKTNEEIIKLFNEGLRLTDIARRTEMDFNYVGDLLLANTETREKLIARRDGSDLIPQVRELFKNGLNMLEIRNKLKKDMKTIRKIINEDEELSKLQQERIRKRQNLQSIATELREFLLSGESYDAAMKKFNLSRTQIHKFVQTDRKKTKRQGEIADGLRLPDRRRTRIVLPRKTERDNEIVKLYKQGTSRAELMQMFRITPSRLTQILKKQKTRVDSKLSSGKTNRANRRANNSKLSSSRKILPDAIKLTKAEQKILKEVRESGTPDFAKIVHAVALGYDEPGSILDNMKPTNMAVTMKNARTVSSEIQRQAQESLEKAGFPEEFSVWRTAGAGGRPNTGVVSVTTRKGGLRTFKGDVAEYKISRSDVLTHGEGFLGNLQTFAEDELHVDIKNLRRADETLNRRANNSRLSSGQSPVFDDQEKKQILDILGKEFPGGITNTIGKIADYSGSRFQNNKNDQVELSPEEKKAVKALEDLGKIIDQKISKLINERKTTEGSKESQEIRLLSEKEKTYQKVASYFNAIQKVIDSKYEDVAKIDKQVRKSIVSNIYKIPKKTSNIDMEYMMNSNKISGSHLVQLIKDVRKNLTAGELLKIDDAWDGFFDGQPVVNFSDSTRYLIKSWKDRLYLTDLVSEADMAFLELKENKAITHDIMRTLNLADQILKSLIQQTQREERKILELSDAEVLDFIEREIYQNGEAFGPKLGSKKYRRNILTGQAFTSGEDSPNPLPELNEPPLVAVFNEKSAKDLLIKTIREALVDEDVNQVFNKSLKAREDIGVDYDEKLGEGVESQYLLPQNLPFIEFLKLYNEKRSIFQRETFELLKETQSLTERGSLPELTKYGLQDFLERQEAELKRELFVQALGELGVRFTQPENVKKTVVRLYMQRLNDFYLWAKNLNPNEDFGKYNPYEYIGGEKGQRHATTIPLMNKVLSLIPENLTNGSLIVELPPKEAERLANLGAAETFGYFGRQRAISKYFSDAWNKNPLEKGGHKLGIIWRLVPGKNRAHAHNVLNGKVLITQEPAPVDGPTDSWESVALHEISHGIEYANPVVTALEWMYWASRRKANEQIATLQHKNGKKYRDKSEVGIVDEWGESYAGKIYEGRPFDALEIFTTGMQAIFYENTSKNADPSHRAFTIGVLIATGLADKGGSNG